MEEHVGGAEWRIMREMDLPAVRAIADAVHRDHPEGAGVFAERLQLHPAGCLVLDWGGHAAGYVLSHPWTLMQPPDLNTLLSALPAHPTTYYIHDLALLPATRGMGAASGIVRALLAHARSLGLDNASLVSVGESMPVWERQGFIPVYEPALDRKLQSYGTASYLVREIATGL